MKKPSWRGSLGMWTLAAMVGVLLLGIVLVIIGSTAGAGTVRGVGVLLGVIGLIATVGLLLRWIVYRGVG